MTDRFSGFPVEAIDFYVGLEADNSRGYWQANKTVYDRTVKGPMEALSAVVTEEFGPLQIFRPHRDVRFSKDKTPYKTAMGAMTEGDGGELYYVQFSATGLMAAAGYYRLATDQLARYRTALDDDAAGAEITTIVAGLEAAGYGVGAYEELKSAPRGYAKDHPRITLLRRKGLIVSRTFPVGKWLATPKALARVVDTWRGASALNTWLNRWVGPSTLAPSPDDAW